MKYWLFFSFTLILQNITAQIVDSIIINRVDSLITIARDLTSKKEFEKAFEVNAIAERIALEKFGHESASYGTCCFNRGRINDSKREFPEAEKWYTESKIIYEKVFGKEHNKYATTLNNLASLSKKKGDFERAEILYSEAATIREKVLGKNHPDYASSLNNLAILYKETGNFERAETLYLKSIAIREKVFGKEHSDYASSLNNLADLYYFMGKYEKEESLLFESKAILEKTLGKEHPYYALVLNNLALLYKEIGNYEKSEINYLESKAIQEKKLGKEHPDYASSLNNLGALYKITGNFEKAELLYLESKAIWEKIVGKEHPDYAMSLNNLAALYEKMGSDKKAELLYIESNKLFEKTLGKEHPTYATSLDNLAILYKKIGEIEKAEIYYQESKKIREKILGKEHPEYSLSLNNLATLFETQKRFSESEPLLLEFYTQEQNRLTIAPSFLSERELSKYSSIFQKNGVKLGAFLLARNSKNISLGNLSTIAYDHALFHKGYLLNISAKLNTLETSTLAATEKFYKLKSYRRQLAAIYSKPIAKRKGVAELEEKTAIIEKELANSIGDYSEFTKQIKWQEVQNVLTKNEAAIEFVHYQFSDQKKSDSCIYAALILYNGCPQPLFIQLFDEKQLTHLLSKNKVPELISQVYTSRGIVQRKNETMQGLYDLIWKPIDSLLKGINTIYYSPSGLLHRINFDAIPIAKNTINNFANLAEKYKLVRLGSTRSLEISIKTKMSSSNKAILFGGINFNTDISLFNLDTVNDNEFESKKEVPSYTYLAKTIKDRGSNWEYLPGTEKEIKGISKLLKKSKFHTTELLDKYATEEVFKLLGKIESSPRILHIATHGFFFPDPDRTISEEGRMSHERAASEGTLPDSTQQAGEKSVIPRSKVELQTNEPVFKISDQPMLRSGLILAGGNTTWQGIQTLEGKEDGILTAYEISQMNLSNTELVVLSACETGLGDIHSNEGVYGLQRAFKIAGAKYLIMSLWQVPDEETKEYMIRFYKNWLNKKLSIPDAFRKTQQEMRKLYEDPYKWAGFVLVE
ncbi:MAG: CHAT domain-containing protein [Saprospiraceae bacterium]|nr:CHAT domain-containing protein [Saprospiraceae bacterium]